MTVPMNSWTYFAGTDQPVTLSFPTPPLGGIAGWSIQHDVSLVAGGPVVVSYSTTAGTLTITDSVTGVITLTYKKADLMPLVAEGRGWHRTFRTDPNANWALEYGPIKVKLFE